MSEGVEVRRAERRDVEPILDLLAFYDAPRSYFEPFYYGDPTYRPEHSWVAEEGGRLLAHLRVFDRRIRASGTELRVAGIGNVITAPDQRGRGLAGRLLRSMLAEIPAEGFSYSLLRAYQPSLYERHGWTPIAQELVRATVPTGADPEIRPFTACDLPDVMRLYDEANAKRSGTTVRSSAYWRSQLEWLNEDREGFLLSRGRDGSLAGYVRSRRGEDDVEVLELGLRPGDAGTGRALLSAAADRGGGRLRAFLPPSLRTLFSAGEIEASPAFGLMGRVLHLDALLAALEPVWLRRLRESGLSGGVLRIATSAGHAGVRVSESGIRVEGGGDEAEPALDGRGLAHLLFRGFGGIARETFEYPTGLLPVLFPEQDFVVWRADAF